MNSPYVTFCSLEDLVKEARTAYDASNRRPTAKEWGTLTTISEELQALADALYLATLKDYEDACDEEGYNPEHG